LLFGIITAIITLYHVYTKRRFNVPEFAGLQAIADGVDRAVEMGKPVHFTGGERCEMTGMYTPMTVAMFGCLAYTAGLCADKGARLIVSGPLWAETMPIIQRVVYEAYASRGKEDKYDERDVRYYGSQYTAGVLDVYATDGIATNIVYGAIGGESWPILERGKAHGALTIGGNGRWNVQYPGALLCDYMFVGEEIFAAAAVMSNDHRMISTVHGSDILKTIVLALTIIGSIASLAGSDIIATILNS
jgi:hypothetical protein